MHGKRERDRDSHFDDDVKTTMPADLKSSGRSERARAVALCATF
jgi:hypothetical protein